MLPTAAFAAPFPPAIQAAPKMHRRRVCGLDYPFTLWGPTFTGRECYPSPIGRPPSSLYTFPL